MRSIGMDVHRDFCAIVIAEDGAVRAAGLDDGGRVSSAIEECRWMAIENCRFGGGLRLRWDR